MASRLQAMATLCWARVSAPSAVAAVGWNLAFAPSFSASRAVCCPAAAAGGYGRWQIRGMAGDGNAGEKAKMPARFIQVQKLLNDVPDLPDDYGKPTPKITMDHVTVTFARSGGAGGQNVNKVNTKVDMRFNVMASNWLPERIRLKLLQQEKNRINGEGEIVVSSTRTRTQKGNIEDALAKLQDMIDAAAYVQQPPSEETKKKIQKLAQKENERRLQDKKKSSSKKSDRRNKGSWD
ncbi:hypothetical protein Mapa_000745 [Marchantia paleacea]|nr:hypothetical protein Mapa_000745 [Marchantia paleacea]